ncbi:MAG TPA: glycosyltransferase family 2 protein [Methylomirabilota bacterium]|jgi:glycosyltransferase involved in cell wall biosynthesis|nr:glycosyltransferase family 2 protein [Methylomirabilota bacterium]
MAPEAGRAKTLSVIVPVYNERHTIRPLLEKVAAVDLGPVGLGMELIVVDDGSRDGTREILRELTPVIPFVLDEAPVNQGKGAAIRRGLERVSGEVVIIQDADLELDPGEYPALIEPILAGRASVVYGSRFRQSVHGIPRLSLWANRFLTGLTNLLYGAELTDMETCYKVFRSEVIKGIHLTCRRFEFEPEVTAKVLRLGHRIVEVPISFSPRSRAEGKKINWRDGVRAILYLLRYRVARRASLLKHP